ncbi:MAG TPA: hypothetical protein VD963_05370 [Phycisphaerales bacterium]|nr:hypothetical protein [Phycisphaerales bacterium]
MPRVGLVRVACVLLAAACGGCYYPGGPGYSADRYTYESTSWQPWTVALVDTRTEEVVWQQHVPVGYQLVVDFESGGGEKEPSALRPDLMRWQVMPAGRRFGQLESSLAVPPRSARRLDPTFREVPEMPGQVPPPPTAPVQGDVLEAP